MRLKKVLAAILAFAIAAVSVAYAASTSQSTTVTSSVGEQPKPDGGKPTTPAPDAD